MCGITGLISRGDGARGQLDHVVRRMARALAHRGPDDEGVWSDPSAGVALGHRRLSILDLSAAGSQPMLSVSGRFVISYNGEIYNHLDLRNQLAESGEHVAWRGHSDTETLLAAIESWGLEEALRKSVGMFALAVWDRSARTLSLACDRAGEKPLYYGAFGSSLLFGSELKALRAGPGFRDVIDRDALALYVRLGYIPGPYSVFKNVCKLVPGTVATFSESGSLDAPVITAYWCLREVAARGLQSPLALEDEEARQRLEFLLSEAVRGQMVADVPLGAFLSGGVDSSTVVALMQAQSSRRVRTFTIGFNESGYDEALYARQVSRHLGTDHTELYVTPKDAREVIPCLPEIYDEPFADSSQIPTFLVAKMARQHVIVSLSGDGGDELFGGYNRYFWAMDLWRKISMLPPGLGRALGRTLARVPESGVDALHRALSPVMPRRLRVSRPGEKVQKVAAMMAARSPHSIYHHLLSHWREPESVVLRSKEPRIAVADESAWLGGRDFESEMMYMDSITYLPWDILVKVDRAAMAVSLETRVPMLDHRVIEFAWQLPLSMKIRNGQGKWLLREVLYSHVPRSIIDRPKMGFGVPIGEWLRGPLREWAEELLSPERVGREGLFNPGPLREKWREHIEGKANWQYHLWNVLVFQSWREHWASNSS